MLQTTGLVKQFKKLRAVDGLNLEVKPGQIVGLIGPNGAGKTTTLRCLCGILKPTDGQVLINGISLQAEPAKAKQGLAFVPEVPALYDLLTVEEHLRFIAMCYSKLDRYDEIGSVLLDRYNLLDKKRELVATLSKGMRQKLAVACALIHDANVFLFDEPMIGIDPSGVHQFKQELIQLRANGASILVSTHLLDTAERLCDRVVIMNRGKIIVSGTLEELRSMEGMNDRSLEDVFLMITEGKGGMSIPPVIG